MYCTDLDPLSNAAVTATATNSLLFLLPHLAYLIPIPYLLLEYNVRYSCPRRPRVLRLIKSQHPSSPVPTVLLPPAAFFYSWPCSCRVLACSVPSLSCTLNLLLSPYSTSTQVPATCLLTLLLCCQTVRTHVFCPTDSLWDTLRSEAG